MILLWYESLRLTAITMDAWIQTGKIHTPMLPSPEQYAKPMSTYVALKYSSLCTDSISKVK